MTLPARSTRSQQGTGALLDLLDLEPVEVDMFRSGQAREEPGNRLFGGQVAAQAMVAAERTVDDVDARNRPHSLHAYFLRPGDTGKRVVYRVDRLHDGRTFKRRRVTAIQDGAAILALETSFTTDRSVADQQPCAPVVPHPDACQPLSPASFIDRPHLEHLGEAFELRAVPDGYDGPQPFTQDLWFRTRGPVADARVSSSALLTYISDLTLISALVRLPRHADILRLTSLDHALWFHNEIRFDDWLLYAKNAVAAGPLRGLAHGGIFHRDGTLIASVTQEGLIHSGPRPRSDGGR